VGKTETAHVIARAMLTKTEIVGAFSFLSASFFLSVLQSAAALFVLG
jgi:hypothetical protein